MNFIDIKSQQGWNPAAVELQNDFSKRRINLFTHLRASGRKANRPNGDAFKVMYRKKPQTLRLTVADGVTGQDRDDLPLGYLDPATYAAETAVQILSQAPNVPEGLQTLCKQLYRPDLDFNSPRSSVAVADITLSRTSGKLDIEIFRVGDCEIYTYRNGEGWYKELDIDMLSTTGRTEFTALCERYHPLLNQTRDTFGDRSREFQEIFDEFYKKEQLLLGDPSSWDSPPVGRYPYSSLSESQKFKKVSALNVDGIVVCSDGPQLNVDDLNEAGSPTQLNTKYFRARYKPWNDMAVTVATIEPLGR